MEKDAKLQKDEKGRLGRRLNGNRRNRKFWKVGQLSFQKKIMSKEKRRVYREKKHRLDVGRST